MQATHNSPPFCTPLAPLLQVFLVTRGSDGADEYSAAGRRRYPVFEVGGPVLHWVVFHVSVLSVTSGMSLHAFLGTCMTRDPPPGHSCRLAGLPTQMAPAIALLRAGCWRRPPGTPTPPWSPTGQVGGCGGWAQAWAGCRDRAPICWQPLSCLLPVLPQCMANLRAAARHRAAQARPPAHAGVLAAGPWRQAAVEAEEARRRAQAVMEAALPGCSGQDPGSAGAGARGRNSGSGGTGVGLLEGCVRQRHAQWAGGGFSKPLLIGPPLLCPCSPRQLRIHQLASSRARQAGLQALQTALERAPFSLR